MFETDTMTLVSGAASDIGRAICGVLALERRLLLTDLDQAAIESVRQELPRAELHGTWAVNLCDDGIHDALTGVLRERQIGIHGFVHVAGLCTLAPVRMLDRPSLRRMFEVNVFSAIEIIRALVSRRCNAQNLGSVVLVSSISALLGTPGFSGYAASKAALIGLARSMAVELAPRVRVNCVLPGGIRTRGTQHLFDDDEALRLEAAAYPLGEGTCDDIAQAVHYLVSGGSRWVTGQCLTVDGGRTLR